MGGLTQPEWSPCTNRFNSHFCIKGTSSLKATRRKHWIRRIGKSRTWPNHKMQKWRDFRRCSRKLRWKWRVLRDVSSRRQRRTKSSQQFATSSLPKSVMTNEPEDARSSSERSGTSLWLQYCESRWWFEEGNLWVRLSIVAVTQNPCILVDLFYTDIFLFNPKLVYKQSSTVSPGLDSQPLSHLSALQIEFRKITCLEVNLLTTTK